MKNIAVNKGKKPKSLSQFMDNETVAGYVFALPFIVGFLFLMAAPMALSFYYSFTEFDMLSTPTWVGLDNYVRMMNDRRFTGSVRVTFRFVFLSVPVRLVFGLMLAYVLTRKAAGVHFYRSVYYLPTLIGGSIAVALVWGQLFQRQGVVNVLFNAVGLEGVNWFGNPNTALYPLILMSVWQFGSSMLIFAAGLKDIPETYYEAAEIDGANKWHVFFRITLPCLSPIILYNLVMQTIAAFMTFTQAFIITGGGPANATNFLALYIYNHAFNWFNMGYASAMSWVLLMMVAVSTAIILKTSKKWTFYANE
ncbi:MAG: sugar ABC transporter permease [Defluviitaleaceae bacterium]|nr:sugar ABC transporter permease [Defluviitaleaceae bacterium]